MFTLRQIFCSSLTLGAAILIAPASQAADAFLKYQGKSFTDSELQPAMQQALYDAKYEYYQRVREIAEQVCLDQHLNEQVKKTGKSREQVEETLLAVKEPTDKEVNTWYEANKHRLPPGYKIEQISGEIKQLLKSEGKKKRREELLGELKKKGQFELALAEPKAPVLQLQTEGFPSRGPANAKVVLVEFADYQCPHCKVASEVLDTLYKKHKDKIKFVFLDYPINPSGVSLTVAHGGVCADEQGRYWDYHHLAFKEQSSLNKESPLKLARDLKLDEGKFTACLNSPATAAKVSKAKAEGQRIGLTGTPSIYINGQRVKNYDEYELEEAIKRALR